MTIHDHYWKQQVQDLARAKKRLSKKRYRPKQVRKEMRKINSLINLVDNVLILD